MAGLNKYQAYPEYKSISNPWLDRIPDSWLLLPLKYLCASFVKDGPHETPLFLDEGIPFLSVDGIQDNKLTFEGCRYVSLKDHLRFSQKCKPTKGDVLLGKAASVGKVALVDTAHEFNVWSPLAVITPVCENISKFIYYSLQSTMLQAQCEVFSNSNTQKNLGMSTIDNLDFAFPSDEEALTISGFLDHETSKIDNLIEKQQQLIELLKEKRQAVISHAVTKGLNPDVPMNDSGVEWLGEVPEHWSIKSYRYACLIYRGKFGHRPRNDPSLYDGNYPFIQTGDVARAGKFIETYSQTLNEKGKSVSQLFPSGTLMMAIAANIGDTAILGFEAYAPDSVVGFKPYKNLHLEFLRYSFMAALPALEQTSTQSTQANLNIDRIGAVKAVFPPLEEQLDIINYIDDISHKYDSTEESANLAIQCLQERRTALISAAVTGKIDVRNWVAPDSQEIEESQETAA
ncbi:restriction endonuclease subunit S [Xenorhabdus bovienii]|uniref:restriction endonuclease subunit S n=1 Tax=Xenorhabdus bovienii TaxID=40576 RepID=UPI0023B25128|nr:restriction endonuclease subunit S [Xenorhabdus bovienii]MDE9460170.1 restriction endonuclease subunit S [Xenorhabdus bovienii]MDE9468417.1 restriction endonuclease subunit S [Xenorhabdus bovienii]